MKTKMMSLILALSCCIAFAQHDHAGHNQGKTETAATFKDAKLGKAYILYLKVKDALVLSLLMRIDLLNQQISKLEDSTKKEKRNIQI